MQIPEKIRAKARTDPSHKYQLVALVEADDKRAEKLPRAFRFGISTDYKLLFMEQLDLDLSDAKLFANRSALFANDAESAMIACSLL
jgi:hypothetical protein